MRTLRTSDFQIVNPRRVVEVAKTLRSASLHNLEPNTRKVEFSYDPAVLTMLKGERSISVVLPAHNEEATVGIVVRSIRESLVDRWHLVDEIIVMDDRSTDRTAQRAVQAGATVVHTNDVLPAFGTSRGKGDAIWRSLAATRGDFLVWCDADLQDFNPEIISELIGPLLTTPKIQMVKGYFGRTGPGGTIAGGRVTELTARPLIELLAPHLAHVREPLGGMFSAARQVIERIPIECDYGVDLGILADVAELVGADAIAQVDLGEISHNHRSLEELGITARQVARAILRRFDPGSVTDDGNRRPPYRSVKIREIDLGAAATPLVAR